MQYIFTPFKTKLREHLKTVYPEVGTIVESAKNTSPELQALYSNLEYKMNGLHEYRLDQFTPFTDEKKRLLAERRRLNANRPSFHRYMSIQRIALDSSWRRPRGLQNKLRRGLKDKGTKVNVGFGGPALVRYLNRKGYPEIRVESNTDLMACLELDPKCNVSVVAGLVGLRRTIVIENTLFASGWYVDNAKILFSVQ